MQNSTIQLETILSNLKIAELNEMQLAAIDAIRLNEELILLSATGTGKTLAYLLPVLELLDPEIKLVQAMILVPSRELAQQIEQVFKKTGAPFKITCCYGGHLRETEENNLVQPPAILVGTAGRVADHLRRNNFATEAIKTLVLDEFDKSLELGFVEEMSFIIGSLKSLTKRILISATETAYYPDFVGLKSPIKLNFLKEDEAETKLLVRTVSSPEKDKVDTLFRLLCSLGNKHSIVFCNHRESVERTSQLLKERGLPNEFYHGGMEQQERDSALSKFRNESANILITTDLASRGLDIPNIRSIIHYHLPPTEDVFTHRNGRTARMDEYGTAFLILSGEEKLPGYITSETEEQELPETVVLPEKPKWTTLFIGAGKKDKVNKIDIVGFLSNRGNLKKDDIGLIEVKDFFAFVAVRKTKVNVMLPLIQKEKIKNKKVKIDIAK